MCDFVDRLHRIYSVSPETFCPLLACMSGMRITLLTSAHIFCLMGVENVEHKAGHTQAVDCRLDLSQQTLNISWIPMTKAAAGKLYINPPGYGSESKAAHGSSQLQILLLGTWNPECGIWALQLPALLSNSLEGWLICKNRQRKMKARVSVYSLVMPAT